MDEMDSLKNKSMKLISEFLYFEIYSIFLVLKKKLSVSIKYFSKYDFFLELNCLKFFSSNFLFNFGFITSKLNFFFSISSVSQLFDDNNIFSEFNQRNKVTPFGFGGLRSKRGSLKLRDIHPSHYGSVCLIETVEGENAGLIFSFVYLALMVCLMVLFKFK